MSKKCSTNLPELTSSDCTSGFSLIETLVAISIMLLGVVGVMSITFQVSQSSQQQIDRLTASYLASDAIEYVRNQRDEVWLAERQSFSEWAYQTFDQKCENESPCRVDTRISGDGDDGAIIDCGDTCSPLQFNTSTKVYSHGETSGNWQKSKFTRSLEGLIRDLGGDNAYDEVELIVTVKWSNSNGQHSLQAQETLTDWQD